MEQPDVNCDSTFKLVPRWDKYINVLENYKEKMMMMVIIRGKNGLDFMLQ
jgi:hypothetical protein